MRFSRGLRVRGLTMIDSVFVGMIGYVSNCTVDVSDRSVLLFVFVFSPVEVDVHVRYIVFDWSELAFCAVCALSV